MAILDTLNYWSVPRCWPGETVAILGGGPSLTQAQIDYCAQRCRMIAINKAYTIAPSADWLWGCDADRFWAWCPDAVESPIPVKIVIRGIAPNTDTAKRLLALQDAGVMVLAHSDIARGTMSKHQGVSSDPRVVRGNNSCYQILSIIAHTAAARVILLGIDHKQGHWHDPWPVGEPSYARQIAPNMATLAKPLAAAGVEVINCSPGSALECFPKAELKEAL